MNNLNFVSLNTNKYFVGAMMITLTLGGRFIIGELTEKQKNQLDTTYFRKIFIFCAFFMATRDVIKALFLTIIFSLILYYMVDKDRETEKELEDDVEKEYISNNSFVYL